MQTIQTYSVTQIELIKEALPKAMSYQEYKQLVEQHVQDGTNSGAEVTASLVDYTMLNHRRMKRLSKTIKLEQEAILAAKSRTTPIEWLVITESWCGDAAQSTPVMEKFANENPNISLKVVLRDQFPALMEAFLTNGAKSIPKLIAYDAQNHIIVGDWGPRPTMANQLVTDYKAAHGSLSPQLKQDLQIWYNKNKGHDIANDLSQLL
jgi:hypothetical protein